MPTREDEEDYRRDSEEQDSSDSDENDDIDDEEDETYRRANEGHYEDHERKRRDDFRAAKNAIRETGKFSTDDDLDRFFNRYGEVASQPVNGPGTLLHGIVDLVSDKETTPDNVHLLVKRLTWKFPDLLRTPNEYEQNPIYKAISQRAISDKIEPLIKSMLDGCLLRNDESGRDALNDALETPCAKDAHKTCLHLVFEKNLKLDLTRELIKNASHAALKAQDTNGKTPLHYAVKYSQCTSSRARAIKLFLRRDAKEVNRHRREDPHAPLVTFLDVQDKSNRSVYQEHLTTKADYKRKKKRLDDEADAAAAAAATAAARKDEATTSNVHADIEADTLDDGGDLRLGRKPTTFIGGAKTSMRNRERSRNRGQPKGGDRERGLESYEMLGERERARQREREEARQKEKQSANKQRRENEDNVAMSPIVTSVGVKREEAVAYDSANPDDHHQPVPNTAIRRVPTGHLEHAEKKQSKPKVDMGLLAMYSADILMAVKLHYMRTRDMQRVLTFLYGDNPDNVEISFASKNLPARVHRDQFERTVGADSTTGLQLDAVLQSALFTDISVMQRPGRRQAEKAHEKLPGRQDMEFFFDWLYAKGVRHILKLVVEEPDGERGVHSDQSMLNTLKKISVEQLDWQKEDLDPETIREIDRQSAEIVRSSGKVGVDRYQLKELTLRWSGKNAVLRGWSEHDGLPRVRDLSVVRLHIPPFSQLSEPRKWIEQRVTDFISRLNEARQEKVDVKDADRLRTTTSIKVVQISGEAGSANGANLSQQPVGGGINVTSHQWIKSVERFAGEINVVWDDIRTGMQDKSKGETPTELLHGSEKEVVVALIDDGVSAFHPFFNGRVKVGKSFDYHQGILEPSYVSAEGHGTEMAMMILRTCPMAQIYPIRLKMHKQPNGSRQLVLREAALAIKEALDKNATIISMSWTVPEPKDPDSADMKLMKQVLDMAKERKVLMFCSRRDHGNFTDTDLPAHYAGDRVFRIGAARHDGTAHSSAGPTSKIDFTFPGVDVISNIVSDEHLSAQLGTEKGVVPPLGKTGSSIATAFAAGLAAMIIYCFKISILTIPPTSRHGGSDRERVIRIDQAKEIIEHDVMKGAFNNIGRVNEYRFIQVWDSFDPISQALADAEGDESKHESIADFCTNLVKRKLR